MTSPSALQALRPSLPWYDTSSWRISAYSGVDPTSRRRAPSSQQSAICSVMSMTLASDETLTGVGSSAAHSYTPSRS